MMKTKKILFAIFLLGLGIGLQADKVNGWEALHEAVFAQDMNRTENLVEKKHCDIDAQSKAGISPLHIAVKIRDLKMVDYLLRHGADVDIQDNKGRTPLQYAISQRRLKIVIDLVRHEADVNLANDAGITPLQQAAYSNDFAIVDFLLQNGADPNQLNKQGINACELAYIKGNFAMAYHLLPYTKGICGRYADQLKLMYKKDRKNETDRQR